MKADPITGLKICPRCRDQSPAGKPADAFNHKKGSSDGLSSICRECASKYMRERRKTHTEYFRLHDMIRKSRQRAREKSIPCIITDDDIFIPANCPVPGCGRPLIPGDGRHLPSSPSIDMYNPILGYIPDNIWIICNRCNSRKQDMSGEDHITFGMQLVDGFKKERERVSQLKEMCVQF